MSQWRILVGDVRDSLARLYAGSVQTCVTSPPYWGLRDYGHAGQIGLEATPDAYVAQMVDVFSGVRRVLKDDGTVWLNLGDSYAAAAVGSFNGGGFKDASALTGGRDLSGVAMSGAMDKLKASGLKQKDLVGIPWRVAFALQADGWYLRSDIIWSKPNPMPESVTDRPTKAHEYIFLLSKRATYYYNADAIKEPHVRLWDANNGGSMASDKFDEDEARSGRAAQGNAHRGPYPLPNPLAANKRSVWHVATQPYAEAHFATFPEKLIEPCILAGSKPGDLVLDPFCGSGTTGIVSVGHGRDFIGCELNPAYVELARTRIGAVSPLFAEERTA